MTRNDYEICEVVKEYSMYVPELGESVRAKIKKQDNEDGTALYFGSFSHYCMQAEGLADVYVPSSTSSTIGNVEYIVETYLRHFTTEHKVEKNKLYDKY